MQEVTDVCLCAVGKLSSCRTAPATCSHTEPGWEQSCACHSTQRRVKYWEKWALSLPVCVAVEWTDLKSVLCRACLIARLCCAIPTAGAFAASIQVSDIVQSLWGSFQQGLR